MAKKLSNLVNPALNKCSLSLGKDLISYRLEYPILATMFQMIEILTFFSLQPSFLPSPNILNYRPDIIKLRGYSQV